MRRDKMPTYILAAAVLAGVLLVAGVPLASLALPLVVLACPLMMIFMMRGMNHGGDSSDRNEGQGAGCHGGHSASHDVDAEQQETIPPGRKDTLW